MSQEETGNISKYLGINEEGTNQKTLTCMEMENEELQKLVFNYNDCVASNCLAIRQVEIAGEKKEEDNSENLRRALLITRRLLGTNNPVIAYIHYTILKTYGKYLGISNLEQIMQMCREKILSNETGLEQFANDGNVILLIELNEAFKKLVGEQKYLENLVEIAQNASGMSQEEIEAKRNQAKANREKNKIKAKREEEIKKSMLIKQYTENGKRAVNDNINGAIDNFSNVLRLDPNNFTANIFFAGYYYRNNLDVGIRFARTALQNAQDLDQHGRASQLLVNILRIQFENYRRAGQKEQARKIAREIEEITARNNRMVAAANANSNTDISNIANANCYISQRPIIRQNRPKIKQQDQQKQLPNQEQTQQGSKLPAIRKDLSQQVKEQDQTQTEQGQSKEKTKSDTQQLPKLKQRSDFSKTINIRKRFVPKTTPVNKDRQEQTQTQQTQQTNDSQVNNVATTSARLQDNKILKQEHDNLKRKANDGNEAIDQVDNLSSSLGYSSSRSFSSIE